MAVIYILFLLAVPTFYIWRWVLKKFIREEQKRTIATWTATLVATPLIYVGIIMLWMLSLSYYPAHDFDRQKWLVDKDKRYELTDDLIDRKLLIGKTKAEVRQLLGDEQNADGSDVWNYYVGYKPRFINIDPDIIVIQFIDGKVVSVMQRGT